MLVDAIAWAMVIWAWLGAGYLVIDGERWPVWARVVSYACYTAIIAVLVSQLL